MGKNVLAITKRKLPPKCEEESIFAVSCKIGASRIKKTMRDLGASINVMSLSIYSQLKARQLKERASLFSLQTGPLFISIEY